jgi:propanol-preferring alcohol dehydrogenase
MRAMAVERQGAVEDHPLAMKEMERPEPGEGEVLIKVSVCGVCHTDLHVAEGDLKPHFLPLIPGHQIVGSIETIGGGVNKRKVGERVGIPWLHSTCGKCEYCLRGQENLCNAAKFTGLDVDGGFTEFVIARADFLVDLPKQMTDMQAAPMLCAGIIGYRAVKVAGVKKGDIVALAGFGASAHIVIQLLRKWNCDVFVFSRSEAHRSLARKLGAAWTGDPGGETPSQADHAISFAPSGGLIPDLLRKIKPGGCLVVNAVHASDIPAFPYSWLYGERKLTTVANATRKDGMEFMQLAEQTGIVANVSEYALEDVNRALLDIKHSRIDGEAVLRIV